MGYWKDFQEKIGGGIREPYQGDYVCAYCFGDGALKAFVEANAVRKACTFCGAQGDDLTAAPFLEVIEHMSECLAREYDTAENCLPYESAEGGYQGTVWTTYELLTDQLELELPNDDDDRLLDAISDALGDRAWCNAHPFSLADSDRLRMSWVEFCEIVKHRRRFFFMDDHRDPYDELLGPGAIIEAIGLWCQRLDLVADLPPGTKVFRARYKKSGLRLSTARDLGPPCEEQATQSNRMSPPGIVMFYTSDDPETGLRETFTGPGTFVVGEFEIQREVKILDLVSLPPVPSIFQELPDTLESVRRLYVGLQSFRSMSRMDASLMKASALRLRFSQSLASRRQRLSQAMVRSTTQRLGWTTKPFTRSDRLTISVSRSGRMPARAR